MSETLVHNAAVRTMDPARPCAEAVAVRDGRIVAAGSAREVAQRLGADAERVDCAGGFLLPAFIDAHCHLLSYAASLRSVDCTRARSIAEVQRAIAARAAETPPGVWVRAFGYEDTALAEGRHPARRDLDAVAPEHPVRLVHRSGHASVLNSLALRLAGIDIATEEPPGGAIGRELDSGEPDGLLLGMEERIDRAMPPLPYEELRAAVREASSRLLRAGVACVQDATHTNSRAEWELFERLIADGALRPDVVLMEGLGHMGGLPERGADGRLRRGAVKVMIHELGDAITPDERELRRIVAEVHAAGRQMAVHAVGARAVATAADAIAEALRERPRAGHRHRIEHCSLLPEGLAPRLAGLGIVVVSQPSFLRERGDRYLTLVPEEEQPGLYAFRTLAKAGVALAAGSDAPVTTPDPLASAAAATDRRSASGRAVVAEQAVGAEEALGWWTAGAARASFLEQERGAVRPSLRADLVLLSGDGSLDTAEGLRQLSVGRMWLSGQELALE